MMHRAHKVDFDVAIIGAGLVGSIQALMLAKKNFNVLLIDTQPQPDFKYLTAENRIIQNVLPDLRMSAITPKNQKVLDELGVWSSVKPRSGLIKQAQVWDDNGAGDIIFDSITMGANNLAVIVENNFLLEIVTKKIINHSNIKILRPSKVKDVYKQSKGLELVVEHNQTKCNFTVNLLIGADGAQSWVRNYFNFAMGSKPYDHTALVTNIFTEQPHHNKAHQIFLADGPLAFLPWYQPNCCSIVWSQSHEHAVHWQQSSEAEFFDELSEHIEPKLGKVIACQQRFIFPLHMQHVKKYYKSGAVLIGDAAHTIHPLAGQGLNLGIYDSYELAEVLSWARSKNYDLAHDLVLKKYELKRKGHNQQMIDVMASFRELYGKQNASLGLIRSLGMNFVDNFSFLKKRIMLHASGLTVMD